jgi:ABC-type lipoprotein export system ATPase subunit/ABC-type antimicrobial peptide transport system permease subunit
MNRNNLLIRLENIAKIYKMGEVEVAALRGISYSINQGDFVAIMGPSGSGKSTLMNIIGCLDKPTSGKYYLDGKDISSFDKSHLAAIRNNKIGFVFQNFNLLTRTTALENTELPLLYSSIQNKDAHNLAIDALSSVGLKNREHHKSNQISGGEKQRVAIARALVNNASLILADEPTGNLDTKTSKEIMGLFRRLNKEKNITIILVTHDADVAKEAEKIIHIRDGLIEKEETTKRTAKSKSISRHELNVESSKARKRTRLNTIKTIPVALRALKRHKMRSFLTALGIIIGVSSVVAMVSIGQGAKVEVEKRFDAIGTNMLFVSPGSSSFRGVSGGSGTLDSLTEDDAKAIEEGCIAVNSTSPIVSGRAQVVYGSKNWNTSIQGVDAEYPEIKNWAISEGIFFDESAVNTKQKVCVLGKEVSDNLFGGEYPVGKTIRVDRIPFKVIGVMEMKGESGGWFNQDDMILMPYSTAQKRLLGIDHIQSIEVSAVSREETAEAQRQIEELLRVRHKIAPGAESDFNVRNMSDVAEGASESTKILTILLGGIASVSLLVGGIGIMNIMLVSVMERIREIGIRMSVGAREKDILLQFITEAIVLSVAGGIIGIMAGVAGSKMISQFAGWQTLISFGAIALAFFFSGSVGVFFGYYPAKKASQFNPIEALRYE